MTKPKVKSPKQALLDAIDKAGSQTNLANLLGLNNPSQISSMLNRDGQASVKWCLKISQATGVPCHELRPDIYPAPAAANDDSDEPQLA